MHGLSNPGTDDRDEMGVCVEPPEYLLGFQRFEHFVYRTQPEGHPSGPGDLDLTVYGLRKFCVLALKGSPDDAAAAVRHRRAPAGDARRPARSCARSRPAFVARSTGRAFLGYLTNQRRGLTGERHATRTRELSELHGYDTKYAMHALRIAVPGHRAALDRPDHAAGARAGAVRAAAACAPASCRWTTCWRTSTASSAQLEELAADA